MPPGFLPSGGLGDAIHILKDYNRQLLAESNKAKEIETEIIAQLTGLRSDLQQKIKEIKSLSGDFKSSVDKEQEATKRAVRAFQEALGSVDHDSAASSGKGDPFIVKMGVDRQVERQIDEENYLHRVSSLRPGPGL
jgi:ribosomal protein L9